MNYQILRDLFYFFALSSVVAIVAAAWIGAVGLSRSSRWTIKLVGLFLLCLGFFAISWTVIFDTETNRQIGAVLYLPLAVLFCFEFLGLVPTLLLLFLILFRRFVRHSRFKVLEYFDKPAEKVNLIDDENVASRNAAHFECTRRAFLGEAAAASLPLAGAVILGVHGTSTRYDLRVRSFDLPISDLPDELVGVTVAHVSDIHSGIFCDDRRLQLIRDTVNDLKPDLCFVTGDLINASRFEIPSVLAMIKQLEAGKGVFLSQGNHDLNPGEAPLLQACAEYGLRMLYNERYILPFDSCKIELAGLPWINPDHDNPEPWLKRLFPAYPQRRLNDRSTSRTVRFLLSHHPHIFEAAAAYADAIWTGHVHGGQIMVGNFGIGSLLFRYWSGLYERRISGDEEHMGGMNPNAIRKSTLVVSNGCGDWFPCRVGAPAEILKLILVRDI